MMSQTRCHRIVGWPSWTQLRRSTRPSGHQRGLRGSCLFGRQVVSEFARGDTEGLRNVNHGEDAGVSLTVFDVDETAKAQVASFGELFEAVAALSSDSADLHAERQEAGLRCRVTVLHSVRRLAARSEHHEQLCIITFRGGKSCPWKPCTGTHEATRTDRQ